MGELDIMGCGQPSSFSLQIACGWLEDEDLFSRTYPMDLRPQGQDIRTWLFSAVADLEFGRTPRTRRSFRWILDSITRRCLKSKGNVVTLWVCLRSSA